MRTARFALTVALVLAATVPVAAQEKKARGGKLSTVAQAMMRMEKLHTIMVSLDLSADQEEQHKKLHADLAPKMKELMSKLEEIVTDEQQAAAKEAAKQAKEAGKTGRAFFAAVESSIELTDEQKEKVNKVGEEMLVVQRDTVKQIREILTDEQKKTLTEKLTAGRKKPADAAAKKKAE
jgi:hypothetical protein